jgi:hypothetical protein
VSDALQVLLDLVAKRGRSSLIVHPNLLVRVTRAGPLYGASPSYLAHSVLATGGSVSGLGGSRGRPPSTVPGSQIAIAAAESSVRAADPAERALHVLRERVVDVVAPGFYVCSFSVQAFSMGCGKSRPWSGNWNARPRSGASRRQRPGSSVRGRVPWLVDRPRRSFVGLHPERLRDGHVRCVALVALGRDHSCRTRARMRRGTLGTVGLEERSCQETLA